MSESIKAETLPKVGAGRKDVSHVYVSMFGPLPDKPTGLAQSVLRRAKAFAKANIRTTILVDQFVPDIDRHLKGLVDNNDLAEGMITVRSMHKDFAGWADESTTPKYVSPRHDGETGWEYAQDPVRPEVWRGRIEDDYQEFVWMRDADEVNFIDYLTNEGNVRLLRTWYDAFGRAGKIEWMDQSNKPSHVEYLRNDGSAYLVEDRGDSTAWRLTHEATGTITFRTYDAMYEHWLRRYIFEDVARPVIISEYGLRRNALRLMERDLDATLIYTFHSSHLGAPYTYGSAIRGEQRDFLEGLLDLPALVVLTNEQKHDLHKAYGDVENVHVIPHHAPQVERNVKRDPNKIVMVGRFDKNKGHVDALKAFSRIQENNPKARLEIYGRGPAEKLIGDTIEKLGLRDTVSIMGFTDDAASVFSGAAVSLVTSNHEGFCLSLIESMAQGCVPVIYDFKYGPADIVKDGIDGFIVGQGNIADLADSVSLLMKDNKTRNRMSVAATTVTNRFTEKRLVNEWKRLISRLRTL